MGSAFLLNIMGVEMKRPVLLRCSFGSVTGTIIANLIIILKLVLVNIHVNKILLYQASGGL